MMFQDRLDLSGAFEDLIIDRLIRAGWHAEHFGQRQLSEECRDRLKRFEDAARRPSLIRWMPDILAFCDLPSGRSFVALIDAKVSPPPDTGNYAIERSAVEALEIWTDHFYTPTFFVFDDWQVLTPREARQRGRLGPEPGPGRGSGTPYFLIAKRNARAFDAIFPAVVLESKRIGV
jgi:hypothetical protein